MQRHAFPLLLLIGLATAAIAGCGESDPVSQADVAIVGELPCEVDRVLKDVCRHCHGSPTRSGAPFSLMTYADTQTTYMGQPVWKRMNDALQTGMMPMPPVTISEQDKAALLDWLGKGAPPANEGEACSP